MKGLPPDTLEMPLRWDHVDKGVVYNSAESCTLANLEQRDFARESNRARLALFSGFLLHRSFMDRSSFTFLMSNLKSKSTSLLTDTQLPCVMAT